MASEGQLVWGLFTRMPASEGDGAGAGGAGREVLPQTAAKPAGGGARAGGSCSPGRGGRCCGQDGGPEARLPPAPCTPSCQCWLSRQEAGGQGHPRPALQPPGVGPWAPGRAGDSGGRARGGRNERSVVTGADGRTRSKARSRLKNSRLSEAPGTRLHFDRDAALLTPQTDVSAGPPVCRSVRERPASPRGAAGPE